MKPAAHMLTSFSAGLTFGLLTKSLLNGLLCFVAGVFLDIDHVVEFIVNFGFKNLNIKNVYRASEQTDKGNGCYQYKKLHLFLHSAEAAVILCIISFIYKDKALLAVAVGYSLHIIIDVSANRLSPECYFFACRMLRGFEVARLYKKNAPLCISKTAGEEAA